MRNIHTSGLQRTNTKELKAKEEVIMQDDKLVQKMAHEESSKKKLF